MKQILCTFFFFILMAAVIVSVPATAQQPSDAQKAQIKKLTQFLGEWNSVDAVYEGIDGKMEFEMKMEVETIIQGFALEMSISAEISEIGSYAEKDFLTFDPYDEKVTLLTVSNFGEVAKYAGNWDSEKDNILRLSGTRMAKGAEYTSEITFTFIDDETITWKVVASSQGKKTGTFSAKFTKD